MRIPLVAATVLIVISGALAGADPATRATTSPAAPPSTGPTTRTADSEWIDASAVQPGRSYQVTMKLTEGKGEPEISEQMHLDLGKPGQLGVWSPHFTKQGFSPAKIDSSGGFPGGFAFKASSTSDKAGRLAWEGANFASPAGAERLQVTVTWERPDGTRSKYKVEGSPGGGESAQSVAAKHLFRLFGIHAGVRLRLRIDPKTPPGADYQFMAVDYQVGSGAEQKQGSFLLLQKNGYWRISNQQPSPM